MEKSKTSTILWQGGKGRKPFSALLGQLRWSHLGALLGGAAILIFFVYPILKLILLSFRANMVGRCLITAKSCSKGAFGRPSAIPCIS